MLILEPASRSATSAAADTGKQVSYTRISRWLAALDEASGSHINYDKFLQKSASSHVWGCVPPA